MYTEKAREIHESNVAAGWWWMGVPNRNRGEVMMLIVSEVAEASDGELRNVNDDKLPHLPMFHVELADTAIRLYDLIGADALHVKPNMPQRVECLFDELACLDVQTDLMAIVRAVASAMEARREGQAEKYADALWQSLAAVYAVADTYGVNLDSVIAEKRAFNATREDHKLENRMKPGGKAY